MKIVLDNLSKTFKSHVKGGSDVHAVVDFNIEIPDGKLVALLGPSGCGKSTCLNLISGLEDATEGRIFFGDLDVSKIPPENRGVGMVFQNYALYPHLNVEENIMFPLENLKGDQALSKEVMKEKALEVAKLVQIDNLMGRKPSQMSGGQQQRVAIARALVKRPGVLLLDEPLSNLDARLRLQTREEIRRIQRETEITTIFVTHDQDEAMSISDLIIVMKSGRIQQVGKPQEVYNNPINMFVATFLGTPAINIFNGRVKDHKLYIGDDYIGDKYIEDQEVDIGIRPEGFIYDEKGRFKCEFDRVQTRGRDTTIICHNQHCSSDYDIRAIVPDDIETVKIARFNLKANKTYVFSKESGNAL